MCLCKQELVGAANGKLLQGGQSHSHFYAHIYTMLVDALLNIIVTDPMQVFYISVYIPVFRDLLYKQFILTTPLNDIQADI